MTKLTKEQKKRLMNKIAKELIRYDRRYTVASLSILLERIYPAIADELAKQRKEIIEELYGVAENARFPVKRGDAVIEELLKIRKTIKEMKRE